MGILAGAFRVVGCHVAIPVGHEGVLRNCRTKRGVVLEDGR